MLRIKSIGTALNKLEKNPKEHLAEKKNVSLIRQTFDRMSKTKTAQDFDESRLPDLKAVRSELNTIRNRLAELQKSRLRHAFSAMKRKSCSREQNSDKNKKRKKVRHLARTIEVLNKIAPELAEGKACRKEDLRAGIITEFSKRQKKWIAALTSPGCSLLDDSAKSKLRKFLGFVENENQYGSGDDADDDDDDDDDDESDDDGSGADESDGNESDGGENEGEAVTSVDGSCVEIILQQKSQATAVVQRILACTGKQLDAHTAPYQGSI